MHDARNGDPSALDPMAIAEAVELGEAEAMADLYAAAPRTLVDSLGIGVERIGSTILLSVERIDILLFNRALGLGIREVADRSTIDAVTERYERSRLVNWGVPIGPMVRPTELPSLLVERGMIAGDNWSKVYRRAEAAPEVATDLRIERFEPDRREKFASVACLGFGMPPTLAPWLAALVGREGWLTYGAFDGAEPVAVGALYVRDGTGWLGLGCTLPEYRRRGAQGAIMAARVNDGIDLGCRWLVTETGEETPARPNPSYRNMIRSGFTLAYNRRNMVRPGSTAARG